MIQKTTNHKMKKSAFKANAAFFPTKKKLKITKKSTFPTFQTFRNPKNQIIWIISPKQTQKFYPMWQTRTQYPKAENPARAIQAST